MGENDSNYLLHFNPRFDLHGDVNKIVCNSKEANSWGEEKREDAFPFQQGAETTVGGGKFFLVRNWGFYWPILYVHREVAAGFEVT